MNFDLQKEIEKDGGDIEWVETVPFPTFSSSGSESGEVQFNSSEISKLEKGLLRKIDLNVLPLMAISMLISFLVCLGSCRCQSC